MTDVTLFEEINYINKDDGEKTRFLNQFMAWLKAMSVDFKMTVANEYQSCGGFCPEISVRIKTRRQLSGSGRRRSGSGSRKRWGNPTPT